MGKGLDLTDLIPMAALGAATGGIGSLGATAGGLGAGSAATGAGLGMAGDALAAQGAAGLLGTAGATAAGYAAPTALLSSAASALPSGMASFGPNGEFTGPTIGSELNANPFTGGFDNKNIFGQTFDQITTGMNDKTLGDGLNATKGFMGRPQAPQQPKNVQMNTSPRQQSPSSPASFVQLSNNQQGQDDIERQRYEWLKRVGYV